MLETLGDINDLVYIGDNQAYTLATDGLLTLYDTLNQNIVWKKQLPVDAQDDEEYELTHIGRNLMVYSNRRAVLINSVGHVIFEVPLEGDAEAAVEMFQMKSDIYTTILKGNKLTIYKEYVEKAFV